MKYGSIQTDRLESFARRLLGLRGSGLIPTVSPEVALEFALPESMDLLALADLWTYGASGNAGPVAAEFSCVTLENLSPNLIMTAKFSGCSTVITTLAVVRGSVALTLPISVYDSTVVTWADTRRDRTSFPTGSLFFESATIPALLPAGTSRLSRKRTLANEWFEMPELVLAPGESVAFYMDVANTQLSWNCEGTVRPASPDELAAS